MGRWSADQYQWKKWISAEADRWTVGNGNGCTSEPVTYQTDDRAETVCWNGRWLYGTYHNDELRNRPSGIG